MLKYVEIPNAEAEDGGEDPAEQDVVSLADLVRGKPNYDVCRIFLASLQLANTGNIDIEGGCDTDEEEDGDVRVLGLDEVRLRFRSTAKVGTWYTSTMRFGNSCDV